MFMNSRGSLATMKPPIVNAAWHHQKHPASSPQYSFPFSPVCFPASPLALQSSAVGVGEYLEYLFLEIWNPIC